MSDDNGPVPPDKVDARCSVTVAPEMAEPEGAMFNETEEDIDWAELARFYTPWFSLLITILHAWGALMVLVAQGQEGLSFRTIPVALVSLTFTGAAFVFRDAGFTWVMFAVTAANIITALNIDIV